MKKTHQKIFLYKKDCGWWTFHFFCNHVNKTKKWEEKDKGFRTKRRRKIRAIVLFATMITRQKNNNKMTVKMAKVNMKEKGRKKETKAVIILFLATNDKMKTKMKQISIKGIRESKRWWTKGKNEETRTQGKSDEKTYKKLQGHLLYRQRRCELAKDC